VFWFWFFAGPALALAVFALRGERKRARFVAERLEPDPDRILPAASVIVSIDEAGDDLRENLAALASLDYPNYELIVTARTAADIPPGALPHRVIVVLAGTRDTTEKKKVANLLAGVRTARKRSEILAFADPAGLVSEGWLRALAAPLYEANVAVSTGYRWFLPEPPDFPSLLRSVWNAPVAGLLGPGDNPFAWTGSVAMQKELFFELRIPDAWQNSPSDSGAVTRAVHRAGLRIAFAPGSIVAYAGRTTMRAFLGSARRELCLARRDVPRLWWMALLSHVFYCGGMAAAIAASLAGSRGAEWALVAQLGLGMLKGVNRATLARAELPGRDAWFKRHAWVHSLWIPLGTWLWLILLLGSALPFGRDAKKAGAASAGSRL
jgi:cellulose synthase/poly-beta-1,6-N-acetylglucosamine synthase-like glycosyltransferase